MVIACLLKASMPLRSAHAGSSSPLRSLLHVGLAVPVAGRVRLGLVSSLPVIDKAHLGPSLPLRGPAHMGSALFALDFLRPGSLPPGPESWRRL